MSLILHLSDIHLAPIESDKLFGDYKSEIVPLQERTSRVGLLENTLAELRKLLVQQNNTIDALVISGDITLANNEEGFKRLSSLISQLGELCPEPQRIVVVPGNHDVTWYTPPSTEDRYENFIAYIREKNYITPLLDGIDFDSNKLLTNQLHKHYLVDYENEWVIIPINSANYSGSLESSRQIAEDDWSELIKHLSDYKSIPFVEAEKIIKRVRVHDAARISNNQLLQITNILSRIKNNARQKDKDFSKFTKIAVLHHHLLPVSDTEEVKSFESITNLGLLRNVLRQNNFRLLLHGHKHTGFIYEDHIYDFRASVSLPHKLLVISGATIGGKGYDEEEVCRLLEFNNNSAAPTVSVASIPAVYYGNRLDSAKIKSRRFMLWEHTNSDVKTNAQLVVIKGDDIHELYERVLVTFKDLNSYSPVFNVVCQLGNSQSAKLLPVRYPEIKDVKIEDKQKWFEEIIDWWQKTKSNLSHSSFTHGNRIYDYKNNEAIDQFNRVYKTLNNNLEDSQYAVITLLDPERDDIYKRKSKFPSFCLLQFVVRTTANAESYLDCIGFYRKQEFKYWLPVNLAELAFLQEKLFSTLIGKHRGLRLGTLTSIASIGIIGDTLPKVAIPIIDRVFDDDRNKLWTMAYALFWREMPNRADIKVLWNDFFNDLIPDEKFDPDGIPVALDGIEFLSKQIKRFANYDSSNKGQIIAGKLDLFYNNNLNFVNKVSSGDNPLGLYDGWRKDSDNIIKEIKDVINTLFGE